MLSSDVIYAFVFGIMLTVAAVAGWAYSKSDLNSGKLAPIRVRVDDRRRGGSPRQREEQQDFTQADVYFWLFVGMLITMMVIAFQF